MWWHWRQVKRHFTPKLLPNTYLNNLEGIAEWRSSLRHRFERNFHWNDPGFESQSWNKYFSVMDKGGQTELKIDARKGQYNPKMLLLKWMFISLNSTPDLIWKVLWFGPEKFRRKSKSLKVRRICLFLIHAYWTSIFHTSVQSAIKSRCDTEIKQSDWLFPNMRLAGTN